MEKQDREKADLATLLRVRRATEVHHQHVEPFGGANVPHVRMLCGEKSWTSERLEADHVAAA
jgi:hypothetical protein